MFGVADFGAFVAAVIIFLAIPGPGNLALINSTGKRGPRSGVALTVASSAFAYGLVAVLLTYRLIERMRASPLAGRVLEKLAALCLLAFGIELAISR